MKPITMARLGTTLLICSGITAVGTLAPAAHAEDDAKIEARVEAWGRNCKNAVAEKYRKATMAEIQVELGATLRSSIDAGQITLKDIQQSGLSYNWSFKKHSGSCDTDGNGNVVNFTKG